MKKSIHNEEEHSYEEEQPQMPVIASIYYRKAIIMRKWVVEDWEFEFTATDGKAGDCRLGIEKGDKFVFSYECPAGICPRVMMEAFTWCEVIRCGGDFTYRGAKEKYEMDMPCPCRSIRFHLKATPINRDEKGNPKPSNPRPEDE